MARVSDELCYFIPKFTDRQTDSLPIDGWNGIKMKHCVHELYKSFLKWDTQ